MSRAAIACQLGVS